MVLPLFVIDFDTPFVCQSTTCLVYLTDIHVQHFYLKILAFRISKLSYNKKHSKTHLNLKYFPKKTCEYFDQIKRTHAQSTILSCSGHEPTKQIGLFYKLAK